MIGFGGEDDSNGFQKLIMKSSKQKMKKTKISQVANINETDHDISQNYQKEGEENYLRQQSTATEALSKLSVHLMANEDVISAGYEETKRPAGAAQQSAASGARQVSFEEACAFAQIHGAIYAEVSAKSGP